jgi:hypothetical protein
MIWVDCEQIAHLSYHDQEKLGRPDDPGPLGPVPAGLMGPVLRTGRLGAPQRGPAERATRAGTELPAPDALAPPDAHPRQLPE